MWRAGNAKSGMGEAQGKNARGKDGAAGRKTSGRDREARGRDRDSAGKGKQRQGGGTGKECHSRMRGMLRRKSSRRDGATEKETPNPRGSRGPHRPLQHPLFPQFPAFHEADYPTPAQGRQQPGIGAPPPGSQLFPAALPPLHPSVPRPAGGHGSRPSRPPRR